MQVNFSALSHASVLGSTPIHISSHPFAQTIAFAMPLNAQSIRSHHKALLQESLRAFPQPGRSSPSSFDPCKLTRLFSSELCEGDVFAAQLRLSSFAEKLGLPSPLIYSRELSTLVGEGKKVYLKLEHMRPTHSFKIRGALNAILANEERGKSFDQVVAASQGNHAQGVAWASELTDKKALIFMPENADPIKIKQTQGFGAKVELTGYSLDEAIKTAKAYAQEKGALWLHPYDDQDVIAGQGTVGLEIINHNENIDTIIVPTGGGGLLSGITLACPQQKVIGVQLEAMPSMTKSLANHQLEPVSHQNTIAGGIAVGTVGSLGLEICEEAGTQMHLVSEQEIQSALCFMLSEVGLKIEGSAVVPVIPLLRNEVIPGDNIVLVISGSNISMDKFAHCLRV